MKINRLCKRFAAVLLSLSMIAAPVYSSGTGLTSFAAAEQEAESNADITVVDNADKLDAVLKDTVNADIGSKENSQVTAVQDDSKDAASLDAGKAEENSQLASSGDAAAEERVNETSTGTGKETNVSNGADNSGSTDNSQSGQSDSNTQTDSDTQTGSETQADSDTQTDTDTQNGSDAQTNSDSQTDSDTQNNGDSDSNGSSDSSDGSETNGTVDNTANNIADTFNSNTPINNAGLEQKEEEKFEKSADSIELAEEDMPLEPEDLIAEYMAAHDESASINLAADNASNSNTKEAVPDIQVIIKNVYFKDSFTIKYKTVSNTQKEFKFTSAMNPEIDILYVPYGNDTYFGFKVLSIAVTVIDKNEDELTFYADDIVNGSFYATMDMQLSNGDKLKNLVYSATPDAEDKNWKDYTDATLISGKYSIKVKKPYGAYLAEKDAGTKTATGKALLIAVDNDSSLGHTPVEDAEDVKAALTRTKQFKESDIELMIIPNGTSDNYKQQVWDWIDKTAAASDNELTLIAYSGHGGFHNDGTSELSIGGSNTISGTELKAHVSKLHGKVVMLFDSCYSGGMIMPTQELGAELSELDIAAGDLGLEDTVEYSEEDYEAYLNQLYEQAQDNADEALDSFISEFNKAKATSTKSTANEYDSESLINAASEFDDSANKSSLGTSSTASNSGLKYYIFAAASAYETGLQNDTLGGQITDLFGYALGYDRSVTEYNIYAADINNDYKVTGKELADYIKSTSVQSKPSVYYPTSNANEALFTYDAASGVPGILSVTSVDAKNLVADANGNVKVNVKVTNHSKASVTFDAGAVFASNTNELCPGAVDPSRYEAADRAQIFYKAGVNKKTVAAGKTWSGSLTFTDTTKKYFSAGGRFIIKIWGTGAADSQSFALTDFYTGKTATAAAADKTALKFKSPAQVWSASSSDIVSAIVPINVVFDTEPTDKSGYAALKLTAKAYDLGTTDGRKDSYVTEPQIRGYGVNTNGDIVLDDVLVPENSLKSIDIYKDIRPTYVRDDVYDLNGTGSNYNYAWDVSGLEKNHYYALQVVCTYDDKTVKKKTTFIKVTDKATADKTTKLIGESTTGMNDYASTFYGLKLGETWKHYGTGGTVKAVSDDLEEYLAYDSYKYDGKTADIKYTIADDGSLDGCESGWFVLNKDNSLTPITDPEHTYFEAGKSYVNRIILTIDSGYDAKFAYGCAFTVAGHKLYSNDTYKSAVRSGQKQAVLYVIHKNIGVGVDEKEIKVCRAGTKTEIKSTDTIKIGDTIDVYVPTGYKLTASEKYDCLKKVDTKDSSYTRYEVVQSEGASNEIKIAMYKAFDAASKDDCCATVFYTHAISGAKQEITGITAPNKTFYEYTGKASKLDLTGAKVDYYALNSKKEYEIKTADLSSFIKNNKAKLCFKSGDKYYEWKDDYLKDFGLYTIYLSYNGEYYTAFDVEVGYPQGKKFSVNGSLTYNKNGSVSYVSKDDLKSAVLSLYLDADVQSNCQGSIKVSQYVKMKYSNVNASSYDYLYFTEGATVKYVIPYPQGITYSNFLVANVEEENKNVPVKLEVKKDGIWVTAYRSGEFTINIDTGGKGGPDDPDDDSKRARNSSGRTANGGSGSGTNSKVYGSWKTDTLRIGSAGASGVINVNGIYVVPSTGVIEPDGSSNAASAVGTETVTLYRFMMNNGEYATGWKQISYSGADKWFFFGNDGYMRVGWAHDNNTWYYLHSDGTMATGWIQNKDAWYYLGTDGKMLTGWQQIGSNWYYLDADGHMLTGQQMINGKTESFRQDGSWIEA